ncbi:unnamed protein product [Adineta steineri]|uniref:Uncharacterized protein n=1 Tax=Adineta steineri TaxID=433720 RepID=A0A815D353_9BILA|nr:unnamed protein product [Adineta steineri]
MASSSLLLSPSEEFRGLPKCPRTASATAQRIKETTMVHSSQPAALPSPTQLDMIRIFNNKNVLFLGDSGARFLYRDLYRILHKDRSISPVEIRSQWGHHPCYINESPMKLVGKDGVSVETNCRMFKKLESSTTLLYPGRYCGS